MSEMKFWVNLVSSCCTSSGFLRGLSFLANIKVYRSTLGFPGGSAVKKPPASTGDVSLTSGLRRSPGGGNGNPLQYSCLEDSMDRGAWWARLFIRSQRVGHNWAQTHTHKQWVGGRLKTESRQWETNLTVWQENYVSSLRVGRKRGDLCIFGKPVWTQYPKAKEKELYVTRSFINRFVFLWDVGEQF